MATTAADAIVQAFAHAVAAQADAVDDKSVLVNVSREYRYKSIKDLQVLGRRLAEEIVLRVDRRRCSAANDENEDINIQRQDWRPVTAEEFRGSFNELVATAVLVDVIVYRGHNASGLTVDDMNAYLPELLRRSEGNANSVVCNLAGWIMLLNCSALFAEPGGKGRLVNSPRHDLQALLAIDNGMSLVAWVHSHVSGGKGCDNDILCPRSPEWVSCD